MNVTPKLECLDLRIEELCSYYGRFRFGPLRRGQGITVGNALRRVLLSELSGVAITGVRFINTDSIVHEFSTVPGIKESVFEILLHLKEAVISKPTSMTEMEPQKCSFVLQGPGRVNVQAIPLPAGLEFVNPNQYLATVYSESAAFPLELTIEFGKGGSSLLKKEVMEFIPVESTFVPVKKANYIVEDMEVTRSEMERRERIIFEIWTNGSVSPQEAISEGAQQLMELFIPLLEEPPEVDPSFRFASSLSDSETPPYRTDLSPETVTPNEILIEDLGLSVRSYNCLKRAQIHTVSDLLDYSQQNLLEIKNFGSKSAEEVAQALQNRLGIELPK
jgi:DNA-directed RNA polymerase subunit alpha